MKKNINKPKKKIRYTINITDHENKLLTQSAEKFKISNREYIINLILNSNLSSTIKNIGNV